MGAGRLGLKVGPRGPYLAPEVTDMTYGETMTGQQAHDKLISMGFRPEAGSSRYRNAAGDIGRRHDAARNSYEDRERISVVRKGEEGWLPDPS